MFIIKAEWNKTKENEEWLRHLRPASLRNSVTPPPTPVSLNLSPKALPWPSKSVLCAKTSKDKILSRNVCSAGIKIWRPPAIEYQSRAATSCALGSIRRPIPSLALEEWRSRSTQRYSIRRARVWRGWSKCREN